MATFTGTITFNTLPHEHEDRNQQLADKRAELEAQHGTGQWHVHVHDSLTTADWTFTPHA